MAKHYKERTLSTALFDARITEKAEAAFKVIIAFRRAMSEFSCGSTEREQLSSNLISASLEFAAAAASLVRHNASNYFVAVHVLERPQLEYFYRGVVFSSPETTASEVEAFVKAQTLPKRKNPKTGKRSTITFAQMQEFALKHLRQIGSESGVAELTLLKGLNVNRDLLNSFMHGDDTSARLHRLNASGECSTMIDKVVAEQLERVCAIAMMSFTYVIGAIAKIDTVPSHVDQALRQFKEEFSC